MSRDTHAVKRTIIDTVRRLGEASPSQIAEALGEEWREERMNVRLRQILRRLTHSHRLKSVNYGVYALSPNYHLRGLDGCDLTERSIEEFLIERCGVESTDKIHDAVGVRNLEGGGRDYEHQRVTMTLSESPIFHQDFGPGRWNLDAGTRERLPVLGKWADYEIQVAWFEKGERGAFVTWEEMRADYFDRVGSAFMEARGDVTLEAVAGHPAIREALLAMADAAPNARADAIDGLRQEVEQEAKEGGQTNEWLIGLRVSERKPIELPVHLYAAFELGDFRLHLVATPEFYRECAGLFGVCPARLSRGEVVALVPRAGREAG